MKSNRGYTVFKKNFRLCNIIILIMLVGCKTKDVKDSQNERIDFEALSEQLFHGLDYKIITSINKSVVEISGLQISKDRFSDQNYEIVKIKLIEGGWRLLSEFNGINIFCKGTVNRINIINRDSYVKYDAYAQRYELKDLSYWGVSYSYNYYGNFPCEK